LRLHSLSRRHGKEAMKMRNPTAQHVQEYVEKIFGTG